jgi:hypothetical protein
MARTSSWRLLAVAALVATLTGCYPGGIGKWKSIPPGRADPPRCSQVTNPCGQPWNYPPLHD